MALPGVITPQHPPLTMSVFGQHPDKSAPGHGKIGGDWGKTTPDTVNSANMALYRARVNLPLAAESCGMTIREMKFTFREFLKSHPPDYTQGSVAELVDAPDSKSDA